ncbi:CCT motif family protein [Striga hermonthica]|uniref:CCT motif family protein n=1 Tax=Striga hermonthica TaxID=68872 RepID=A0A9N7R5X0_STRHE|nr:CCT motif family protein [Striga hermonthica]
MFPYFQNFSQEVQQFEEAFCCQQLKPLGMPSSTLGQTPAVSDYNLWAGDDLFKAPEPIIEEPTFELDPLAAAISMISCGEDAIPQQSMAVSDIESSIENGQLLSEVFYECQKDLLAKAGNETPLSEVLKIEIPNEERFQKSVSSACLRSMELEQQQAGPGFFDFPVLDFEAVYGMRRAFSEGDMKTLDNNGNVSQVQSPVGHPKVPSISASEERREKLSRYWSKKSRRNFDRKIKYACRKALADSQPRVRGRFAKTEVSESCKKQ